MRRYVPTLVFGLTIAWIVTLTVIIWRTPEDGAQTPDALAAAYQDALARQDRGEMRRLAPDADDRALDLLLDPPGCSSRVPAAVAASTSIDLQNGGTRCGRLAIARRNGRWLVDPWAAPFG